MNISCLQNLLYKLSSYSLSSNGSYILLEKLNKICNIYINLAAGTQI